MTRLFLDAPLMQVNRETLRVTPKDFQFWR
jgi:hypothetical protein